jgi:peptide/nickel transport system substrate-binding protein
VGDPIYVGNGPSGVAVGSSVWVTLSVDGAIAKIDPIRGTVLDTFSVGTDPTKVALGYGKVWVTNESVGTVTPIDPVHDQPLSPIPVGGGPNGIAVGDGGVWVTKSLDGTISKIDPRTLRVSETLPAGSDPEGVSVVGKDVWVAARGSNQILRFDAGSLARLPPLRLSAPPQDIAGHGTSAFVTTVNAPASHRGGTLAVAMGWKLHDSIDPQSNHSWAVQPWEMLSMTNDGLVAFKRVPGPDGETVVADLARALPTPTNGGRTYRFQLRTGITYSTGQPVRPEDIRYALERTFTDNGKRTPTEGSLGGLFFGDIVGAKACEAHVKVCNLSSGIKVNDATASIAFRLTHPDPDFLAKLAMPIADAVPTQVPRTDTGTDPVPATGPYMISTYTPRRGAVLVRNPDFHEWSQDAQPDGYPNRIVWHVSNPGADVTAVEQGAADWLSNDGPPEANRVHELETTYAAQLHVTLFPSTEMLGIGNGPLASDPIARRAISYAIDRSRIVSHLGGALEAQPTCQLLPPNFPGYRPYCPFTIQPQKHTWTAPNMSLAKQLLQRANSRGATITVQPKAPNSYYVLKLLRQLGYNARLAPPTSGAPNWQVGIFSFIADYPGAADFITYLPEPLTPHDITAAYAKQRESQYQGTLAWAAADRKITNYARVISLATDKTIGFVAKRVQNYIYSPAPGNDPLIDQMWVK